VGEKFDCFPGKFSGHNLLIELYLNVFSMHASGERLGQLTGIAAILRFPMPDLDLADDHHQTHEPDNEYQEFNDDDLQTDDHSDDNDEDHSTNNYRTLNENRAEASAW
jgi:hypothetical protein